VSAKGWNKTQADLSVRLVPGDSDIPSFTVVSGDEQVMVTWEPVPLTFAYRLFYREGTGDADAVGWRSLERVRSPYNLRNLANGRLYSFRLTALSSEAPELSSGVLPGIPLAPGTLEPTVTGEYEQIRLAWREIPGSAAYEVWRKDGNEESFRRIDISAESVYLDRGVHYGTIYSYRIRPEGVGCLSAPVSGRTEALPARKVEVAAAIPEARAQGIAVGWSYAWIAAGADGVKIYDIHEPGKPVEVSVIQSHDARAVALQGDLVYIADGKRGLKIADVSEPLQPVLLGTRTTEEACDVIVLGKYAYLADGAKGLRVIDVSEPRRPVRVYSYNCPDARAVAAAGERVFVADRQLGLLILDVSLPEKPILMGSLPAEDARDLAVAANLAFVADGGKGLKIVDVADPARPRVLGTYDTTEARAVAIAGRYAYLADGTGGLRIIDVSDPQRPVQFAMELFPGATAISVLEDHAFLGHEEGLSVVHVLLQGKSFEVGSANVENKAFALCVSGDLAFVAGHEAGIVVVDVADPARLGREQPVATWKGGYVEAVTTAGDFALAADRDKGLVVLDVPTLHAGLSPWQPIAIVPLAGRANGVSTDGQYAYVTVDGVGLEIIDLQDIRAPRLVGSFAAPSLRDVSVQGKYAFVAGHRWGLGVLDVSNPASPVLTARREDCAARELCVLGTRLHAVTDEGILVLDIADPAQPREVFLYETPYAENLAVGGSYLYVAEGYRGLRVVDFSIPEALRVVSVCDSTYAVDVAVRGEYAFLVDSANLKAVHVLVPEWMR
jgi:hypothetical protein